MEGARPPVPQNAGLVRPDSFEVRFARAAVAMENWQEDLLMLLDGASSEQVIFERISAAGRALGFDHCAYGFRAPHPVTNPRTILLNDYPERWRERYEAAGYLHIDPTVRHGRQSQQPIVWSEPLFKSARPLWDEARSFGLRVGWAQSSLDAYGGGGMLTLARADNELGTSELASHEIRFRWLTHIGHLLLSKIFVTRGTAPDGVSLTAREVEVLKWTADGKTAGEISDLLRLSENTINFHVKNAVSKLGAANKTAAVIQAAMLGMLN
jgi:DNA-binding CsgD family transcriptional regulator